MTIRSHVLTCLIAVVVAGALAACGGSSAVTGASDAPGVAPATATVAGTLVNTTASAEVADFRASSGSSGIRVTVSGTVLATTTDDDGRFVLDGLTPGEKAELRFEAPGIDARLEIEGLEAGQTLTITVSVSGTTASMLSSSGEVEFRGRVESKSADRLTVAGREVTVSGATEILGRQNQPIPLSDLAVGAFVEVEGWPQPDGSVLARRVKLEDDGEDDGEDEATEVEFSGLIQGLSPLTIAGRIISTDGNTRVLDDDNNPVSLSVLAVGMRVEVEGWSQGDGSVLAKKIKLED